MEKKAGKSPLIDKEAAPPGSGTGGKSWERGKTTGKARRNLV
jgi:hypothetical protein